MTNYVKKVDRGPDGKGKARSVTVDIGDGSGREVTFVLIKGEIIKELKTYIEPGHYRKIMAQVRAILLPKK